LASSRCREVYLHAIHVLADDLTFDRGRHPVNSFLLVLCSLSMTLFGAEPDLDVVKQKADTALKDTQAARLENLNDVVEYANALAAQGQEDEALKYYLSGAKILPWKMDCQLGAAHILKKKGDMEGAKKILLPLLRYMEEDTDYVQGCRELDQPVDPALPPVEKLPGTHHAVVIVPIGAVDNVLMKGAAREVSKLLKIPILVQDARLALPEPDSNAFTQFSKAILREMRANQQLRQFVVKKLSEKKLKEEDLAAPENGRFIYEEMMKEQGVPHDQIEAELEKLADLKQWSATSLLDLVDKRTFPYQRPNVYYMGVTKADMTCGEYNFLFSYSLPGCSVGSYCRFTADFTGETPNRERLARRIRVKVLQCIGKMFAFDTCSDPSCPVSYQNSLEEHDAKTEQFCPKCAAAFKAAVRQDGLGTQVWNPATPPPMGLRF